MGRSSCAGARTRTRASAVWISCALSLALPGAAHAALSLTSVGTFAQPTYVTGPPGDAQRVLVVEKAGVIRLVRDGATLATPFLDIRALVRDTGFEEGLLSMAFAPDYATSRLFYVYYVDNGGNIQVDEFAASSPDVADVGSRRPVATVEHPAFDNHNGGQLQYGPDGLLYFATGDGGGGGDPFENAQNLGSRLGKLLRIDPRVAGAQPEVYAYGLRNPYRFSFDRATGDLTIGDVGQGAIEEIDFVPSSQGRGQGANFGWDVFEGTRPFEPGTAPGHVPPVLEYANDAATCAVTGGYVVRAAGMGGLAGRYVYGDFCAGVLRAAVLGVPAACEDRPLGLSVPSLASFGEDALGRLYAVSLDGPVFRIDGTLGEPAPPPCPGGTGAPGPGAPPGPGGGGAPGAGNEGDARAPALRLGGPRRQRVRRLLTVLASCDEPCRLTARATLHLRGSRRVARLRGTRRSAPAGASVRLRLGLGPRARARARRARSVSVLVRVSAADAAGNTRRASLRIRLIR